MLPVFDELIGECVDEQSTNGDVPLALPVPHHSAQRYQIAVRSAVSVANCLNLRAWIGSAPSSTVVRVWIGKAVVLVHEGRHDFEHDSIIERNLDYLSIGAYVGRGVGALNRSFD